jgi:hypothetical protein
MRSYVLLKIIFENSDGMNKNQGDFLPIPSPRMHVCREPAKIAFYACKKGEDCL